MENRSKPVIFSMARLDKVKNITGLVEWYGQDKRLRDLVLTIPFFFATFTVRSVVWSSTQPLRH